MVPVLLLFALSCSGEQSPTSTGKVFEEVLEPVVTEVPVAGQEAPSGGARRLILVIGDGMGAEQIRAASLYKTGREEGLVLQSLPVYADMATHNASHEVPDSAAAGTAMATAIKVQNGVVGVRLPGEGEDLPSITEQLSDKGWKVGLVTTAHTTHATPAAFGAHVASRLDYDGIARDYLTVSRPHIILGGGGYGMDPETVVEAGYSVVTSREELSSMVSHRSPGYRIAGLFGEGHLPYLYDGRPADFPGLVEMSAGAVEFLAATEDDFFLMIEAARIDHAGHANDIERLIPEVLELDAVVEMLLNHPLLQEDTLLVVTADHETGGLSVNDLSEAGTIPEVSWATICHTAVDVPLFAGGVGAERFAGVFDNTLLHGAMCAALEPDSDVWLAIGSTIPSEEVTAQ
ncbi:MAG: alkaline phosphatase [Spirochaetia bacterium]